MIKPPTWHPVSEFRSHPHGEYLCVLKQDDKNHKPMNDEPPYLVNCRFSYNDGGKILRKGEDYTDRVEWFIINRTTLLILH